MEINLDFEGVNSRRKATVGKKYDKEDHLEIQLFSFGSKTFIRVGTLDMQSFYQEERIGLLSL